jgi:hypothetical protein
VVTTPVPRRKPVISQEMLFEFALRQCQSLPDGERSAFMLSLLADARMPGLLPYMLESTLQRLEQRRKSAQAGSKLKARPTKVEAMRREFWAAVDQWVRHHPGARGWTQATRAWRHAVGEVARRTGADHRTVKRYFPAPPTPGAQALAEALRGFSGNE